MEVEEDLTVDSATLRFALADETPALTEDREGTKVEFVVVAAAGSDGALSAVSLCDSISWTSATATLNCVSL